jgi:hypothetical protein
VWDAPALRESRYPLYHLHWRWQHHCH